MTTSSMYDKSMGRRKLPAAFFFGGIVFNKRGLKYVLGMRQNKLLLRGRLQEIGIVQNGECKVCAQKAMEEEKPIEDLRHIWRDCGIGRERKNLIVKEIAEIIQDSTSGPEWQLLHEVRREDKNVKERKEERQDPQEPDILNTFMYAGREEVQMEGEDGVKAHNVIGGEKKIDRSKKERTKQMIEISNSGVEIWVTLMNFFINELSEKCHERCCARPNHLWGHPKCSLGGPGPHLSGPILLWCRPGRGKPLFWPLGAGIPQQAKTKVAKKAPNLNQRRGWLGGIPKGAWEPRGPWAEPALALGNPLTHNQDKKVH